MSCQKTLTIKAASLGDTPYESAVLFNSPAAGGEFIWAVRGPYVFQIDATTGAIISSVKFDSNVLGRTCIAYDSTNDRLKVAGRWESFPGNTSHIHPTAFPPENLYTINPGTLVTETVVNLSTYGLGSPTNYEGYNPISMRWLGASTNEGLYGITGSYEHGITFRVVSGLFTGNLANGSSSDAWGDVAWDPAGQLLWGTQPYEEFASVWDITRGNLHFSDADFDSWGDDNTTLFGIEVAPVNSDAYAGTWSGGVKHLHYDSGLGVISRIGAVIATGSTKPIYKMRYNPYDQKIYGTILEDNAVAVIDPATDTLVALKTGFDLPMDIVFSSTKKWVVQWGNTGLKELT